MLLEIKAPGNLTRITFAVLLALLLQTAKAQQQHQEPTWIATWTASMEVASPDPDEPLLNLNDQTVRERARVTLGGDQIRLRLSNECGTAPVEIGKITVALADGTTGVAANSIHAVTFNGRNSTVIPAGAPMLSDPIDLPVRSGTEISVSLYIPGKPASVTWHSFVLKQSVISTQGDHTSDAVIQGGKKSDSLVFLSAVLVPAQTNRRVIVAFGDSLIDGDGTTHEKDLDFANDLYRRLEKSPGVRRFAVVNEGVAGNRLLNDGPDPSLGVSGLARFTRDALAIPGVSDVVILEGTNDIGFPGAKLGDLLLAPPENAPTADDIISAYKQLIARAHVHGVRAIGCTIAPHEGVKVPGYHNDEKERIRVAVNQWIRTSHAFDAVIDLDAAVRDPDHPSQLSPKFRSPDYLHPNDAGYQAAVDAIDLTIFR
jgi:lysophospholipase L1-like esterase